MQKMSTGKFHSEPPSRFTSLDHLVGEREQLRRNLRRLRAPLPDESVRRKYLDGRQGNQVATSEHDNLLGSGLWAGGGSKKKKVPIGRARRRSHFAKPVLFLTKSV